MGKVIDSGYTVEFKGRVGRHVFRQMKDGTVIAAIRPERSDREPTPAQVIVQGEFTRAAKYAKRMLDNPVTRAPYDVLAAATHKNPFALAVRDWYHRPTVDEISLARYHGRAGDHIDIAASDDVGLTSVHVTIKHGITEALIEEGNCTGSAETWVYTATTTLPAGTAVKIEVTAKDGTEHEGKHARNYP